MLTNWNPARMPEKDEMKLRLSTARKQLYDLQMKIKEHKIPVIVLFEGWGTSGKGSTIGKVIRNIDPRFFKVVTMSEPTDEELRYPFQNLHVSKYSDNCHCYCCEHNLWCHRTEFYFSTLCHVLFPCEDCNSTDRN